MKIKGIPVSLKNCTMNFTDKNRMKTIILKLGDVFCDIIAPRRCIICNCFVNIGSNVCICLDCRDKLVGFGKFIVNDGKCYNEAVCALPYEGYVRNSMAEYKFRSKKYLYKTFADAVYGKIRDRSFLKEDCIICPVPMHPNRDRNYNQSELIARRIGELTGIEVIPDLLVKIRDIKPLSSMGYSMRRLSIRDSITLNVTAYDIFGKNIILVDDIYTSGATTNECSRILKSYGCAHITVLTACYTEMKGDTKNADADTGGV